MKPALNTRLSQAVVQPANASNASAAPPNSSAAKRKQVFVNTISEAIGGGSLRDADLTALLREVDRLVQHWPDDVRGLVLSDDISPGVRQALTTAIERAGLRVIEHQPSSCSFHFYATEMKRPQAEDADDAVGPEVHFAALAPSRTPRENIDAIEGVLNHHCSRARTQDGAYGYRQASRVRDAVITAVMEGAASVELDLPAPLANELAQLGLTCRPSALVGPQLHFIELRIAIELGVAIELRMAMRAGDAAAVSAVMQGLNGAGLSPNQFARSLREDSGLADAMTSGHAAAVSAFMDSLNPAGLTPRQIEELLLDRNSRIHPLKCAMRSGQATAVTAFMEGLTRACVHPTRICELLRAKSWTSGQSPLGAAMAEGQAAAVMAFMNGLKGVGLSQGDVADIAADPRGKNLASAMKGGHAAAVTAFLDGLKVIGLSSHQIEDILCSDDCGIKGWVMGLGLQPAAVTAFMGGLHGAGLSPDQVYKVVAPYRAIVQRNACWDAYRSGLRLLLRQQLITPEQLSDIEARSASIGEMFSESR